MKVVVTSTGPELTSTIDPRFGRAAWFVLVDTETGQFKPIDNSGSAGAGSGAGVRAAETVVKEGAECVVTGHCGPNAYRALEAAGVSVVVGVSGVVQEAVEKLVSGTLDPASGPDVGAHSGT